MSKLKLVLGRIAQSTDAKIRSLTSKQLWSRPATSLFDSPDRPPFFDISRTAVPQLRVHTNLEPATPRAQIPLLRLLVPSPPAVSVFNATLLMHTRHTSGTCDGSYSPTPHHTHHTHHYTTPSTTLHPPPTLTGLTSPAHSSYQPITPLPSPHPW